MISRKNRFHGLGSLKAVYRSGQTARVAHMALKYQPNERRSSYRLAVVVSKKVNKSAVVRNRIRRRIFELTRQEAIGFTKPCDLVITIYDDVVAEMPALELANNLKSLFRQAGVV